MSKNAIYVIANDLAMILGKQFELELCSSTLISFSNPKGGYTELSTLNGNVYCLSYTQGAGKETLYYEGRIPNDHALLKACDTIGIFDMIRKESKTLLKKAEDLDNQCIFDRKIRDDILSRLLNIDRILHAGGQ